jgi:hypothetical protein
MDKNMTNKIVFIIPCFLIILLSSCSVSTDSDKDEVETLQAKAQRWCGEINDGTISKRCDRLTFQAIVQNACNSQGNRLADFLWGEGAYHRDYRSCYPDESRSECSPDGFIAGLNASVNGRGWTQEQLKGIRSYLQEHDNKCGDGHDGLTDVSHLRGQLDRVIGERSFVEAEPLRGSHNAYLTSIYMDTERVIRGGKFTSAEGVALRVLAASRPNSAPIAAMIGDNEKAASLLEKQFPFEDIPVTDGYDGWGSAPDAIMYVWAVSLLH